MATPASLHVHEGPDWWHALISVELNVGDGHRIRHAATTPRPAMAGWNAPTKPHGWSRR
ncbi:hypothetical protein ACFQ1L_01390 [Phytohabitans flavus]|uniref:hypothetical protein n=1 Tax=Phytohabitans flavus TaxID=1076124 RepID=UPI001567AFF7|nr:hypothetical protein [Phytohabitans flavus]